MSETVRIPIRRLPGNEDIPFPRYMTEHAAGMDICAAVTEEVTIASGDRILIPTGIVLELPPGFEAQIRPRSGLALKCGITLVNSPGTIDADYRGEVSLIMINHGKYPFVIKRGERLAQMVVHPVTRVTWIPTDDLKPSARGEGGFGHTE